MSKKYSLKSSKRPLQVIALLVIGFLVYALLTGIGKEYLSKTVLVGNQEVNSGTPENWTRTKEFENYTETSLTDSQKAEILSKVTSKRGNTGATLEVWDFKDKVVYINVVEKDAVTGHGEWWVVEGAIEKIAEGQEHPDCNVFESRKVGKGLRCADWQNYQERVVTY